MSEIEIKVTNEKSSEVSTGSPPGFETIKSKKTQKQEKRKKKELDDKTEYKKQLDDKQRELDLNGIVHFDYSTDSVRLMIDTYDPVAKIIYQLGRLIKRHHTLITRDEIVSPYYDLKVSQMWRKTGYKTPDPTPRHQYFVEIDNIEQDLIKISKDCMISHKRLAHEFLRICFEDGHEDPYFDISVRYDKKAQVPTITTKTKTLTMKEAANEITVHDEILVIYRRIVADNVDPKISEAILKFSGFPSEVPKLEKIRKMSKQKTLTWAH
jgi:hypothetical protein